MYINIEILKNYNNNNNINNTNNNMLHLTLHWINVRYILLNKIKQDVAFMLIKKLFLTKTFKCSKTGITKIINRRIGGCRAGVVGGKPYTYFIKRKIT